MASDQSSARNSSPSIQVSKSEVMVDEKVRIVSHGLCSDQKVTLLSAFKENEKVFASCGHYAADDQGQVDPFYHHSQGGTFTGIQPMGLFTSTKELLRSSRLMKRDVTTPYDVTLSVHDRHLDFEPLVKDYMESRTSPLAVTSLRRWFMAPGVRRIPVCEGRLYGALLLPPGDGPFPGFVDIFEAVGGLREHRAALLASHGFAAFSLPYMDFKDFATHPYDLETSYFLEAVDWLSKQPMISSGGVGMVGSSLGGNICLTTAALSSQVKAVVAIGAQPMVLLGGKHQFGDVKVQNFRADPYKATITKNGVVVKDVYKGHSVRDYFIPVWKRNVKALLLFGEDDLVADVQHMREFEAAIPPDRKNNFRFVYYPGAGHVIEPPYFPHCQGGHNKLYGTMSLFGGVTEHHLRAQEDGWREIIAFLTKHLAIQSSL